MTWLLAAVALTLFDKAGIEAERMIELLKQIEKLFNEISEGRLEFEDILDTLKEEYGLDLRIKT